MQVDDGTLLSKHDELIKLGKEKLELKVGSFYIIFFSYNHEFGDQVKLDGEHAELEKLEAYVDPSLVLHF